MCFFFNLEQFSNSLWCNTGTNSNKTVFQHLLLLYPNWIHLFGWKLCMRWATPQLYTRYLKIFISMRECHHEFHISPADIKGHFITPAVDFVLKEILKFYDHLSYVMPRLANFRRSTLFFKDLPEGHTFVYLYRKGRDSSVHSNAVIYQQ